MDLEDLGIGCGCLIFTALITVGPIIAFGFVLKILIG